MALVSAAPLAVWLQRLQIDLIEVSVRPMLIYKDNRSTICLAKNPQYRGRAEHIDIKFRYIRKQVEMKIIQVE